MRISYLFSDPSPNLSQKKMCELVLPSLAYLEKPSRTSSPDQLRFKLGFWRRIQTFDDAQFILNLDSTPWFGWIQFHDARIPILREEAGGYKEAAFGGCARGKDGWVEKLTRQHVYASYLFSLTYAFIEYFKGDDALCCNAVNLLVYYLRSLSTLEAHPQARMYYEMWHRRLTSWILRSNAYTILVNYQRLYRARWVEDEDFKAREAVLKMVVYRCLLQSDACNLLSFLVGGSSQPIGEYGFPGYSRDYPYQVGAWL